MGNKNNMNKNKNDDEPLLDINSIHNETDNKLLISGGGEAPSTVGIYPYVYYPIPTSNQSNPFQHHPVYRSHSTGFVDINKPLDKALTQTQSQPIMSSNRNNRKSNSTSKRNKNSIIYIIIFYFFLSFL